MTSEAEAAIRRDLVRGRWIVRLTWVAALASLVLGLVAVRQAALLVAIDPRLVTTEEVQAAGASFDAARSVLIVAVLFGLILAIGWLRDGLASFALLQERGVIGGPPARSTSTRDRLPLLFRPAGVPAEHAGWADLRVGDGRRVAVVAALAVMLAAIVGLGAAVWLGAARDADTSRLLRIVSGLDGGLWLVASILVGVAVDALLWREAVAARAVGVFIPLVDAPGRALFRLVPPALVFVAGVVVVSGRPDPWFVPCPSATLTCDGMLVPVDHDGGSAATTWIVYAVHKAATTPVGTLAIAVGGPGSSGVDSAVERVATFDPELVRRYDILFWDQRGVGASEPYECPNAGHDLAVAGPDPAAAETFARACIAESGVAPGDLGRYATAEAAEDLESIRDRLGIPSFVLYGESYGTELAQTYAARHPDRLRGLILDGAVDLTLPATAFWAAAAHGFDQALTDTLTACSATPECARDDPDPAAAYDRLLERFAAGRDVSFADPDGAVRPHHIDADAIRTAVNELLYDPTGRMLVQRAIAASTSGDDVPIARIVSVSAGTAAAVSFAYYAITCADYRVSPSPDAGDLAAVEAAARDAGVDRLRTADVFASLLPCLYWPEQPRDAQRPPPLTTTPYPVFVLGATDDPITPVSQARAIAGRLTDGYLVVTDGGAHVTFGRHDPCVDGVVVSFLLDGRRPGDRTVSCPGSVTSRYVPTTPTTAAGYADALVAMTSMEREVFADPEYRAWNGNDELRIGCRAGGFVAVTPATVQEDLRFAECAPVPGIVLTGLGTYTFNDSVVRWTVSLGDETVDYESTPSGHHVTGTWHGAAVDLSDSVGGP